MYLILMYNHYFTFRYRNKNRKNNRLTPMIVDHEYLTNKPNFMPKEQFDFIHNKKPLMLPESMTFKYFNFKCSFFVSNGLFIF